MRLAIASLKFYKYFKLSIHRHQELFIIPRSLHLFLDKFHCFQRIHIREIFSHNPHTLLGRFILKKVISSGTGGYQIPSGINTFIGNFPVQLEFHISGSFKFLENHFIHFRACVNQSCCNNC